MTKPAVDPTAAPRFLTDWRAVPVRLAQGVAALRGWRRYLLAMALGACATLAFAPMHLVPFLVPAFTGLLWLLDGARRPREAAALGWCFGFGHMATGLYWVGLAFLVDAERFAALLPVAVGAMGGGMALFPALSVLATWTICRRWGLPGPARVLVLAGFWLAVEWVRSWVLTGFPWNLVGNVWSFSPEMLQIAALGGVWILSLLTVLAAAAPAVLGEVSDPIHARARGRGRFVAVALGILIAVWLGGAWRLAGAPAVGEAVVEGVRLRLVQASIEQSLKWEPSLRLGNMRRQVGLSVGPGFEKVTHVIWPETAVPFLLDQDEGLRRYLGRAVPPGGALVTGAPRGNSAQVWNSILALDTQGRMTARYDKHHLVPFGEYVPFRTILPIERLAPGNIDFTPGPGLDIMALPGAPPASPLVCYEIIFPGQVVPAGPRPGWLLNLTNDAWFGTSIGPHQHFSSARLRAVEEGLPLVRAANTGVSAVVDGYGRVIARLGLNEVGVLDVDLPSPVLGKNLFVLVGNWSVLFLIFCTTIALFVLRRLFP